MMGPYMEILEALAELDRLTGRAPPDLQRGRLDEIEPDEMEPAAADEMGVQGAGSAGTGRTHRGYRAQGLRASPRPNGNPIVSSLLRTGTSS